LRQRRQDRRREHRRLGQVVRHERGDDERFVFGRVLSGGDAIDNVGQRGERRRRR
jgi:hypothetical protein